jgi:hypothetical protein
MMPRTLRVGRVAIAAAALPDPRGEISGRVIDEYNASKAQRGKDKP